MGIFDTVALFGTVALTIPIVLLSVDFFLNGEIALGILFLCIGGGFLLGHHYGLPWIKRRLLSDAKQVMQQNN